MSGSVTDFENPSPFDERDHLHHPVFPTTKRDSCRDEIVGEGEVVIEQAEENPQKGFHKNKGLTREPNPCLIFEDNLRGAFAFRFLWLAD